MQARHPDTRGLITTAVLAALLALVGVGGAIRLAQSAAQLGPDVGDMLAFRPGHVTPGLAPSTMLVQRDGQPACRIDLDTLRQLGGSMVIESRTPGPPRLYHAHWAGRHSSGDPQDCGPSAELQLTDEQMEILAMAAGGYGLRHGPSSVLGWQIGSGGWSPHP